MTEQEIMDIAARLNKAISENHLAFARLGIHLTHANGKPKADSTVLLELCEALDKHESLAFVYACFVDIFGRRARDVVDFFALTDGAICNNPLFQPEQTLWKSSTHYSSSCLSPSCLSWWLSGPAVAVKHGQTQQAMSTSGNAGLSNERQGNH